MFVLSAEKNNRTNFRLWDSVYCHFLFSPVCITADSSRFFRYSVNPPESQSNVSRVNPHPSRSLDLHAHSRNAASPTLLHTEWGRSREFLFHPFLVYSNVSPISESNFVKKKLNFHVSPSRKSENYFIFYATGCEWMSWVASVSKFVACADLIYRNHLKRYFCAVNFWILIRIPSFISIESHWNPWKNKERGVETAGSLSMHTQQQQGFSILKPLLSQYL